MAAGLGFKTFNTGDILSASDVNGYLMQGVLVFTDSTARDAAITSPQEGQFAFTKNNDSLWYYNGSSWVASGATGDIEGVTAGVGISGGGTSGTVTITNSMATAIDAKGDLVVGTGADTFSKLTVGANGTTLVADSAEATGLKWATPAGGGKFLSISETTYSTQTTIASTTFTDTGLTASITPSSATSKVWVICQQYSTTNRASSTNNGSWRLFRDSTVINTIDEFNSSSFAGVTNFVNQEVVTVMYLDSPATTSSVTYKTQGKAGTNLNSGSVIYQEGGGNNFSKMWLIEIGA